MKVPDEIIMEMRYDGLDRRICRELAAGGIFSVTFPDRETIIGKILEMSGPDEPPRLLVDFGGGPQWMTISMADDEAPDES